MLKDLMHAIFNEDVEEDDEEEVVEEVEIPKSEEIGTSLGDLFKNIQL